MSPTILATHYKDPPKILKEHMEIKEIGNLKEGQQSWKSPQAEGCMIQKEYRQH